MHAFITRHTRRRQAPLALASATAIALSLVLGPGAPPANAAAPCFPSTAYYGTGVNHTPYTSEELCESGGLSGAHDSQ